MKTNAFLYVLIISGIFFSCNIESGDFPGEINSFELRYQKASGWTHYSYLTTINQEGKMVVNEIEGLTDATRDVQYQISSLDLEKLKNFLANCRMINLKDQYGFNTENAPTDLAIQKIRYTIDGVKDSTSIYYPVKGEMPAPLDSLLSSVVKLIAAYDFK